MADPWIQQLKEPAVSRRRFLGVSLVGVAAVYSASGLALLANPRQAHASAKGYAVVRTADAKYFTAMLPAVIVQAGSSEAREAFLDSLDRMLAPASPHTLGAIRGLVDLLTGFLTQPLMTWHWSDWSELPPAAATEILEDWRDSRIGLRRTAYQLTTMLIRTAWYMQADQQRISGYPGPPRKILGPATETQGVG